MREFTGAQNLSPAATTPMLEAALTALANAQPEECERLARQALLVAQDASWLALLALSLSQQLRSSEALPYYQELTGLQPAVAEHWSNLGNCLCELGREREALVPLQQALSVGGRGAELHYALGRALLAHAQPRPALTEVERALRFFPGDPEFQLLRARALVMLDEYAAAGAAIDALRNGAMTPTLQVEAGNLLLELGLFEDARVCFERVPASASERRDATLGLAAVHERCNRLEQAEALAIALAGERQRMSPRQLELLLELEAQLASRRDQHALARERLEELLERPLHEALAGGDAGAPRDAATRGDLWLKLGRCRDALGDIPAAMQAFANGHAERHAHVTATHAALPHADGLLAVLDAPVPTIARPALPTVVGEPLDPVFLVGFPRSGTTLLEQLLDAHPALASFDEQPFLQRLVAQVNTGEPRYPEALASMDARRASELRRLYFGEVERVLPQLGARRAVDKNPLNLVRLPLVASLFPHAQVLLALRHPCDVVLSCYMQNFKSPAFAISFETLASTARMYARVMAHHFEHAGRLGLPIHVVRYEDLVSDVPTVGKALFAFLGLPWDDALASFTEHAKARGAISTPSYAQVVRPVNQRAVGRWQRYREWFEGAPLEALQPWVERLGYS